MSELATPALKQSGADMAQGMDAGAMGSFGAQAEGPQSHGEMADAGVAGEGAEIPHRAEMEESFGQDFGDVRAHTGPQANQAARGLGAHAYAVGNNIAFANGGKPNKALVAHELTHVVQQRGGGGGKPQAKEAAGEIDKSGEGEAEAVESAVGGGKKATSALEGGVAKQGSAQLKAGKGIARSESGAPFTFGMSFSPEGMEKTYEYKLWDSKFEVPIPAVPGLNFKIAPSVKVVGGAGVNWHEKALEAKFNVLGNVQMGFSYGNGEIAELYGVMEAKAEGGFNYKKMGGGGESHAAPAGGAHPAPAAGAHPAPAAGAPVRAEPKEAKSWSLDGAIGLSTNFRVGVELGGGWVDYGFDFGKCEIGKLTGLSWKDGSFDRGAVGWEWGPKPKEFFAAINRAIAKAKELKRMGQQVMKQGFDQAKKTGQAIYNSGAAAVNWIASW